MHASLMENIFPPALSISFRKIMPSCFKSLPLSALVSLAIGITQGKDHEPGHELKTDALHVSIRSRVSR